MDNENVIELHFTAAAIRTWFEGAPSEIAAWVDKQSDASLDALGRRARDTCQADEGLWQLWDNHISSVMFEAMAESNE